LTYHFNFPFSFFLIFLYRFDLLLNSVKMLDNLFLFIERWNSLILMDET